MIVQLIVTKASVNDVPLIVSILNQAMAFKIAHDDNSWGDSDQPFTVKEVEAQLAKANVFVLSVDEEPIGTFAIQWEDNDVWGEQPPNAGYLHRLAIKDNWHGKGIGEEMLSLAIKEIAKNKRQYLRLDCDPKNIKLCDYYEKQGFVKMGERKVDSINNYVAALYQRVV